MKTNKKAISLIVLVITIVVLGILAATVIVNISNTNIIEQAKVTAFKSDMANYKDAYNLYLADQYARQSNFDESELNISSGQEYEKLFGDKYEGKLKVENGKLVYVPDDSDSDAIKQAITEMGLGVTSVVKTYDEAWFTTNCSLPSIEEFVIQNPSIPPDTSEYLTTGDGALYTQLLAKESLNGCFDEQTGIVYGVNVPEGTKELTIPESINGISVTGISGVGLGYDYVVSFMVNELETINLPQGITVYGGAFVGYEGSQFTTPSIEVNTSGPIQLISNSGAPCLNTNSHIVFSYVEVVYWAMSGISSGEILAGNAHNPGDLLRFFEESEDVWSIPEALNIDSLYSLSYDPGSLNGIIKLYSKHINDDYFFTFELQPGSSDIYTIKYEGMVFNLKAQVLD
ncbi:MAG: hypothetical protein IKV94_00990 [Clostridia bacterium]|nr:hypothetical protein [Clostridia bacterium]